MRGLTFGTFLLIPIPQEYFLDPDLDTASNSISKTSVNFSFIELLGQLSFEKVAQSTYFWYNWPVNFHLRRFTQPISIWESWPLNFHLRRVTQSTSIWEELANQLSFLRVDHSIFISESWPLNFHFRELATQHPLEAACHSTVLT